MAKAVILPTITFKSKKAASEYFKEMLNRYRDGEELNVADSKVLLELLQRHPDSKIGPGVKRFYRDKAPDYPTSCFHFERVDDTCTDFSYPSCIDGYSTPLEQQFSNACRNAVREELISQKKKLFDKTDGVMTCIKTGELITIENAEYRHTSPEFKDIVMGFIAKYGIMLTPSLVTPSLDMQYEALLTDSEMERLFKEYHASVAHLAMFKKYER